MTTPVKHSLSLAYIRDGLVDPVHDNACQVYGPHAPTITTLAAQLDLIEDLGCKSPCEVMWHATGLDRSWTVTDCDALRDDLKAEAVTTAALVASLHTLAGAA